MQHSSLQTFLSEVYISYYTIIRGPDVLHNVIVSRYVAFSQINIFFANMLVFHHWQNGFVDPMKWLVMPHLPADRSLETPGVAYEWKRFTTSRAEASKSVWARTLMENKLNKIWWGPLSAIFTLQDHNDWFLPVKEFLFIDSDMHLCFCIFQNSSTWIFGWCMRLFLLRLLSHTRLLSTDSWRNLIPA